MAYYYDRMFSIHKTTVFNITIYTGKVPVPSLCSLVIEATVFTSICLSLSLKFKPQISRSNAI